MLLIPQHQGTTAYGGHRNDAVFWTARTARWLNEDVQTKKTKRTDAFIIPVSKKNQMGGVNKDKTNEKL